MSKEEIQPIKKTGREYFTKGQWTGDVAVGVLPPFAEEMARSAYMHPANIFGQKETHAPKVNIDPHLYGFLSHIGDAFEGAAYPFFFYSAITFVAPRVPERLKTGVSVGLTNSIIVMAESGVFNHQRPDFLDMPAGLIGSLYFLLVHRLFRNQAQNTQYDK